MDTDLSVVAAPVPGDTYAEVVIPSMASQSLDRNASHRVASFMAGAAG